MNVKTRRVGGGYGSKLSRACFPAVIAAVCSSVVDKPVKVVMPIETMTSALGRRYSVYATYEVGPSVPTTWIIIHTHWIS